MNTNTITAATDGEVKKYLRLVILSNDRGLLYRKDFEARGVFEDFIKTLLGELLVRGVLKSGDLCSAVVIPRYERDPEPVLRQKAAGTDEGGPWISMEFDEGVDPEQPIRYFTVELHVPANDVTYSIDCPLEVLKGFFKRLARSLVKLGALGAEDTFHFQVFARADEGAELGRDELYALQGEADSLVELSPPDGEKPPEFDRRQLSDFGVEEVVGDAPPADDTVQIVIARPTFAAVQAIARGGAGVEVGGYLVGNVYGGGGPADYLVEVTDHVFAEQAQGSQVELRFTFESWRKATAELKEKFPDRRIVGWYHTHLVKAKVLDEEGRAVQATEHFFSVSDHFMHRQFFPQKWYVAMVLNPKGEAAFFRWRGHDIVRARGFHVARG